MQHDIPRILTLPELAAHLRVSKWTLYRLLRDGQLPHTRIRGQIRFTPENVRRFLARSTRGER